MSRKNVSAIVSGAGFLSAVWTELDRAVRERGGSDEDMYRLNTPDGKSIIAKLADVIVASNDKRVDMVKSAYDHYTVTVDHTRTLADMIKAGMYDYVNRDIVEQNFPIQRPDVIGAVAGGGPFRTQGVQITNTELVFVHLNKAATTAEVLAYMDKLGLRPARIEELLALGEKYPNIQRDYPFVALGSVWVDSSRYRGVPYLYRYGSKRDLNLNWDETGNTWNDICRFVAVS